MKTMHYALLLTLSFSLLACSHKKSTDTTAVNPNLPVTFHKAGECPNLIGTWDYNIVGKDDGADTRMEVEFSTRALDSNIVFDRTSNEHEDWVVDGITHTYESGRSVLAYCATEAITVEVTNVDGTFEVLSFTGGPGNAAPAPTDTITGVDLLLKGVADQDTINALLKAGQTQLTFTRTTQPPKTVQVK